MTVSEQLDNLYGSIEKMGEETRSIAGFNRGTLVIVGDKTVAELMQEEYKKWLTEKWKQRKMGIATHNQALKNEDAFNTWYNTNLNAFSTQFVRDAMQAGQMVTAYTFSPKGEIVATPITMESLQSRTQTSKSSNEQSVQANEAILNRGKFAQTDKQVEKTSFSFSSLFKRSKTSAESMQPFIGKDDTQKAAQRKAHRAACARMMANIKVIEAKYRDPNGKFVTDQFLKEGSNPVTAVRREMVAGDKTMLPICIGIMASKMASLDEKIKKSMTPTQLQDMRTATVTTYMENKENSNWLGQQIFYVQSELLKKINEITNGNNMNNSRVRDEVFPKIYPLARALGETNEYLNNNVDVRLEYRKAAEDAAKQAVAKQAVAKQAEKSQEQVSQGADSMREQAANVCALCDLMYRSASFQAKMSRPLLFNNTEQAEQDMSDGLAAQLAEAYVFQAYKFDSQEPFSKQCPPANEIATLEENIKFEKGHKENANRLACGWKDWKKGANYVISGEIADGVIWYDIDTDNQGAVQKNGNFMYPTKLTARLKEETNPPPQTKTTYNIGFGFGYGSF